MLGRCLGAVAGQNTVKLLWDLQVLIKPSSLVVSKAIHTRTTSEAAGSGPPAFVFDIDGVLIRGKTVLNAAKKAVQQVVLSHTPMRGLVDRFADVPVLISGRGDVLQVASNYGFRCLITAEQLGRAMPTATPFTTYADAAEPCPVRDLGLATDERPIRAVLVMYDPSDWYRDLQLITDVVLSNGTPTRQHPAPGSQPVELFFSNPDLLWANEFPRPRFGQGAFAAALEALHQQVTGTPLSRVHRFGKPNPQPYRLIEQLLLKQAEKLGMAPHLPQAQPATSTTIASAAIASATRPSLPFSGIYAVGDNPASDVRGANRAGAPWVSVLVRTGVFQGSPADLSGEDRPAVLVDDVLDAVQAALHRTRSHKWHSMR